MNQYTYTQLSYLDIPVKYVGSLLRSYEYNSTVDKINDIITVLNNSGSYITQLEAGDGIDIHDDKIYVKLDTSYFHFDEDSQISLNSDIVDVDAITDEILEHIDSYIGSYVQSYLDESQIVKYVDTGSEHYVWLTDQKGRWIFPLAWSNQIFYRELTTVEQALDELYSYTHGVYIDASYVKISYQEIDPESGKPTTSYVSAQDFYDEYKDFSSYILTYIKDHNPSVSLDGQEPVSPNEENVIILNSLLHFDIINIPVEDMTLF